MLCLHDLLGIFRSYLRRCYDCLPGLVCKFGLGDALAAAAAGLCAGCKAAPRATARLGREREWRESSSGRVGVLMSGKGDHSSGKGRGLCDALATAAAELCARCTVAPRSAAAKREGVTGAAKGVSHECPRGTESA